MLSHEYNIKKKLFFLCLYIYFGIQHQKASMYADSARNVNVLVEVLYDFCVLPWMDAGVVVWYKHSPSHWLCLYGIKNCCFPELSISPFSTLVFMQSLEWNWRFFHYTFSRVSFLLPFLYQYFHFIGAVCRKKESS